MLEPLYTAAEMRAAEERYSGYPATAPELMERAGAAVAREVLQLFPNAHRVAVVCGGGANGGDGRIAARILRDEGLDAVETTAVEQADVIVDALFGTGFHGEPRADAAATIQRINAAAAPVVSVDVPSGVDASTGEVAGEAVRATVTVTFHGLKVGLAIAPGRFHTGEAVVADIGLELSATDLKRVTPRRPLARAAQTAGGQQVQRRLGARRRGCSGLDGRGLSGCRGRLPRRCRLRHGRGAGTVTHGGRGAALEPVKVTWAAALSASAKAGAIAIGPGLGRTPEALSLRDELLAAAEVPVVLDADALHELEPGDWGGRAVLTPHAGELARLLDEDSEWVNAHRLEAATRGAERFGCICLLKGADTIIAAPDEGTLVCVVDAPGLATAGTGDVLTGILAAFLAKGVEPRFAAAAAATAHGLAARAAGRQAGLIASDLIAALPSVLA